MQITVLKIYRGALYYVKCIKIGFIICNVIFRGLVVLKPRWLIYKEVLFFSAYKICSYR